MSISLHTQFPLGRIVAIPSALDALTHDEMLSALRRYAAMDWGTVDSSDWQANDESVVNGSRIHSAYRAHNGAAFWIVTEADRSSTTILLPSDY